MLAFALVACGDVNKVTPDAGLDAFQPDGPPMVACQASEMVCNSATCADPMTDEFNCGSCNNQCAPTQTCEAGTCTAITTCKQVRDRNPTAVDGLYRSPANVPFFCDYTNNLEYTAFGVDSYTATPAGYTLVRATDLANATFARAFVEMFNVRGGVPAIETFNAGNCCVSTVVGQRLQFGGALAFVAAPATTSCAFAYTADTIYSLSRTQTGGYITSLPADYLTQFPPTETTGCSDDMNPSFWVKTTPLN